MSGNNLTGTIPSTWTSQTTFAALTSLDLRDNGLAGELSNANLPIRIASFAGEWLDIWLMTRNTCVNELLQAVYVKLRRDTTCTSGRRHTLHTETQP